MNEIKWMLSLVVFDRYFGHEVSEHILWFFLFWKCIIVFENVLFLKIYFFSTDPLKKKKNVFLRMTLELDARNTMLNICQSFSTRGVVTQDLSAPGHDNIIRYCMIKDCGLSVKGLFGM